MLQLKYANELTWNDLKYLETPRDALRTIERVHGSKFTNESIWNAHRHSLPNFDNHVHNGYNTIQRKLEDGQVFLVNHQTLSPIIQTLELKECGHEVEWSLRNYVNDMMRNTLCMAIERVGKPKTVGVLRSTPAQNTSQNTSSQKGPVREQHRILLEVESEDDRPLPDRHNVTLFVENTTKGRRAVNQKHDVIVNQFSREFSAEKGDALKTYVIPSTQDAVLEDLRKNSNVQQSESEGLISALTETGQEVEASGTILHHFTYKVPGKTTFKMMRIKQTPHTTISELTVEHDPSKKWYVLEAGGPDSKVSGKGRIEKGTYQLTPYSSSNYPSEFQLKQVPGRTNIIMYEYDTSTKLTTGLALGKSYDFSDDTKQYYKVDGSADAKKEIYDMIGDGEAEVVIESDLSLKILKDDLWVDHEQLNEYAAGLKQLNLRKGSKGELVKLVQQSLNKLGFYVVEDGDYGPSLHLAVKYFQKFYNKDFDDRTEVHPISKLEVDASVAKETLLALDEGLVNGWQVDFTEAEYRVRAFLRMIRVGEGTVGDIGYETLFTHKSFIKDFGRDYSEHPNITMSDGGLDSTAAGAYQILYKTWLWIKSRNYAVRHEILDFSPKSQDKAGILLLRSRDSSEFKDADTGEAISILNLVLDGRIEDAISLASWVWASLPPGRYGQPNETMEEAMNYYNQYLKDEACHMSDLKVDYGVLREFLT